MSADTSTLQPILNAVHNPAFLEQNGKIVLTNESFDLRGFNKDKFSHSGLLITEKKINGDLKLCEIVDNDIYRLNVCKENLIQALSLL